MGDPHDPNHIARKCFTGIGWSNVCKPEHHHMLHVATLTTEPSSFGLIYILLSKLIPNDHVGQLCQQWRILHKQMCHYREWTLAALKTEQSKVTSQTEQLFTSFLVALLTCINW